MKKLITIILTMIMCFGFTFTAYAGEGDNAEEVDASTPRLMVTSYEMENSSITPGKNTTAKITVKNQSNKKAVKNIKFSLSEETGDIKPVGMGTKYVDVIYAGSTYTWEVELSASATAQIGEHSITVSTEYEDKNYNSYSSSDVIRVTVKQSASLDYDGAQLPAKVVQEDTQTVEITLMNTGKSNLRNCKIDFDVDGFESGGTTFVGEIPAGESKVGSTNLRVSSDVLGDVKGTMTISYEDEFGKSYKKKADLTTKIEKKIVQTEVPQEEEEKKNPFWWLFLIIGAAVGGAIGCAIPIGINAHKQRKEDEMRL